MDQFNERIGDMRIIGKIVSRAAIGLVVLILIFGAFGTVGAGERGILLQFGAVQDKIFGEGLYLKIPLVHKVVKIDVKIQKDEVLSSAASKNELSPSNSSSNAEFSEASSIDMSLFTITFLSLNSTPGTSP